MAEGVVDARLEAFLCARMVEREAEHAMHGQTLFGQVGVLGVRMLALQVELIKTAPLLPGFMRRRLLEQLARKNFGDHPDAADVLPPAVD